MTTTLAKGGNAVLSAAVCRVTLTSVTTGIDVSAVLLGQDGKVRSDDDLVFYNHSSQDGVALNGQTIVADLVAIPTTVDCVAVVASIDPELRTTHFDESNTPHAVIECGSARITFTPPPLRHRETVVILVELYRRAGGWKARAVGQGWDTGLAGLASDFGIVVDDPGPSAAQSQSASTGAQTPRTPTVPPRPTSPGSAPVPQTPATRPLVPLGKVALTKAGQATIDMRKDDPSLVVTATLEWNGGSATRRQAGADLDLYALYVPGSLVTPLGKRPNKSDQVVYYRQLGSPFAPPYIALDGDSRVPGRETITIRRPDLQGYVLLCAYSAVENGTGSFKSYGARTVVADGRGSTVTVPLFNNRHLSYWVAIALIDFTVPGGAQIRHVEKYSGNHVEARPTLYSNGNFRMSTGKVEFKTR
ncbi:TerD family protein [Streptomyces sp. DSM 3412]|uniref:TerD family protein n=1 Tax=Streptomyces gottesmaniae TaxID=3075518 RepID=A0ABU2YZV1_9ACTN|nr:TerD family protein [Streptomyces sp. DSM 3412]MDT0569859.1 TerD family protein [Streptomyces sp. DSM 3412]